MYLVLFNVSKMFPFISAICYLHISPAVYIFLRLPPPSPLNILSLRPVLSKVSEEGRWVNLNFPECGDVSWSEQYCVRHQRKVKRWI